MSAWGDLAKTGKRAGKRPSLREVIDRHYHKRMIGEVSEKQDNLECAAIFQLILAKHIKQNTERQENHRSIAIHPSSISQCPRSVTYKLLDAEEIEPGGSIEASGKGQRIFANGDYYHWRMQVLMVHLGLATVDDVEVEFYDQKFNIMGTCDGLLNFHGRCVLELKSVNDRGFKLLLKAGAPDHKHVEQAHVYMWAHKVKFAYILYECKDNQLLMEHVVEYDQELMNGLLARGKQLWQYVQMRKLAPRPPEAGIGTRYCNYCAFSHICFNGNKEKQWLATLSKGNVNENKAQVNAPRQESSGAVTLKIRPRNKAL